MPEVRVAEPTPEELVTLAKRLVEATQSWFPWRPAGDVPPHVVWTGGFLARCCALLAGMAALVERHENDSVGALYRPLLETYLTGVYVGLGEAPALAAVHADALFRQHPLEVSRGRPKSGLPEGAAELHTDTLAKRVNKLLRALHPSYAGWTSKAYRYHYRPTSYHDVHGGLGAASRYVSSDGHGPLVSATRAGNEAPFLLDMAISLCLVLTAVWVVGTGLDGSAVAAIERDWEAARERARRRHRATGRR